MQAARTHISRNIAAVLLLGVVGLSSLMGGALATGEAVIPAVSVDATEGNGQRKLVVGPDGSMYIIYAAPLEGTVAIVVSRSDDGGSSWKRDAVLSRPGIRAALGSLAFDTSGTLHASWVDYETVGQVWYASRTDTWSESEKISPGPEYAGFPVIVTDRGGVHVLWYGAKPDLSYRHGSLYEIRHTYLTESGWSEPDLVSIGSFDALNPTIAAGPGGSVVAAWYQRSGDLYRANVATWTGSGWDVPKTVSTVAGNAVAVSMDVGPDGTVHLIWQQFRGDIPGIAYAASRDGSWSDPVFVADGPAATPVIGAEANGRVVAAWSTEDGVAIRRRDGSWGSPVVVGDGDYPTLLPGDPVYVMWTRPRGGGFELVFAEAVFPGGPTAVVIIAIVVLALGGLGGVAVLLRRRAPR